MIQSIRHKGLRRLYQDDDPRGVLAEHAEKLRDILARLDAARKVEDMDRRDSGFMRSKATGGIPGGHGSRQLASGVPLRRSRCAGRRLS
jgi:hypothetical protein